MRYLSFRTPIVLVVLSAFLVIAPAASAADPGTVEFTGTPAIYMNAAPTITWGAWGELSGATCEFSKLSPSASTPFNASCTSGTANAPTVNTASSPTLTSYSWDVAPLTSGDGSYRVTYTPAFTSYPAAPPATRDFVIDSVNPVVTASAPNGLTTDSTPEVGYTVQDVNPDRVICAVDPPTPIDPDVFAGFAPCPASPYSLPPLSDGAHSFFVVAQDKTGNYGYALRAFSTDSTGPTITVTGLVDGEVLTSAWPPLSVGSTDAGTGVYDTTCAYDATPPTTCSNSSFLNTPLEDGPHTLSVVSKDAAGNTSTRTIRFSIDTTGGLTQGLIAPKTAKFAVMRGKLKGSKYSTTLSVSFAMPAGSTATSCSGSAKLSAALKKKQLASASPKFKKSGAKCVGTAKLKISKKYKGKKLALKLAYKSGPIKAFTISGSGKL